MLFCCNGKHIDKATLTCRKAGDRAAEYIEIMMEQVIVTSVSTGGSGGEDRFTENVTLNFAQFKKTYTPQKDDGNGRHCRRPRGLEHSREQDDLGASTRRNP